MLKDKFQLRIVVLQNILLRKYFLEVQSLNLKKKVYNSKLFKVYQSIEITKNMALEISSSKNPIEFVNLLIIFFFL